MTRTVEIEIYRDIEWFIEDKSMKANGDIDMFAVCDTADDKIVYAFDISVDNEMINEAKKDKRFLEVCKFRHEDKEFVGTFIDALEYIKANWRRNA